MLHIWLKDIRFWLLLFIGIHLLFVTQPPLDYWHTWRQGTGLMVARNFYEIDGNILYPRVDEGQWRTGIVGMEFPILYYVMSWCYELFGFQYWYGRLINVLISILGIFYFYKILKRYWNERLAFYAALILCTSVWLTYERKTMTDTTSVALVMMGMYYGLQFLYDKKNWAIIGYFFLATLGVLSKIPAGLLLPLFILPMLNRQIALQRKAVFCLVSIFVLIPIYYWYFIWNPHLSATYDMWYNIGTPIGEGIALFAEKWDMALKNIYFYATQSYVVSVVAFAGLICMIYQRKITLLAIWFLTTIFFYLYGFKSGELFLTHHYYAVPYSPIMALLAAFGLSQIPKQKFAYTLLAAMMIEGILNQQYDVKIKEDDWAKMELESIADQISERGDLIAMANLYGNPLDLYLTHRRGWIFNKDQSKSIKWLSDIGENRNCKYLFINKLEIKVSPDYYPFPIIYESDSFMVLDLQQ